MTDVLIIYDQHFQFPKTRGKKRKTMSHLNELSFVNFQEPVFQGNLIDMGL